MQATPLKTLIVDDSLVFRKILIDLLSTEEALQIVGQAPNGKIALQKIISLKPDLVFLDLDMPEMNGLELIEELKQQKTETGIIIVSGASPSMCRKAISALDAGAFEFVAKPQGNHTMEETRQLLRSDLQYALQAFINRRRFRGDLGRTGVQSEKRIESAQLEQAKTDQAFPRPVPAGARFIPDLAVIGISTGGPPALMELFSDFNIKLKIPIIIVQHIPENFSEALAQSIKERSGLDVQEVCDDMPMNSECIYIARGGRHLALKKNNDGSYRFRLTDDPPVNNCKPSIDYLIESLSNNFSEKIAFFIMTGMGMDGLAGARIVRDNGGYVIAQDEKSCVVYGMPRVVVEAKLANEVLSLKEIRNKLERLSLQKIYQSS